MNCWGVVWQYEGVFIQRGESEHEAKRPVSLSLGLVLIVTYFATSFMVHVTWSTFYVETELEKKRIKRNWNEKKNKEKIFEMIESCLFIVPE